MHTADVSSEIEWLLRCSVRRISQAASPNAVEAQIAHWIHAVGLAALPQREREPRSGHGLRQQH